MRTNNQGHTFVVAPSAVPLGYQKLTNLATAVGLTVPDGATTGSIQPLPMGC